MSKVAMGALAGSASLGALLVADKVLMASAEKSFVKRFWYIPGIVLLITTWIAP